MNEEIKISKRMEELTKDLSLNEKMNFVNYCFKKAEEYPDGITIKEFEKEAKNYFNN